MRIILVSIFILLKFFCSSSQALTIIPDLGWGGNASYYDYVEDNSQKIPYGAEFPMVFYLFGSEKFYNTIKSINKEKSKSYDGITLPLYLGYLVVDSQYKYNFLDKSNGMATPISELVNELNIMSPEEKVCNDQECFPRWSFKGFWISKDRFDSLGLIDRKYPTQGYPPDNMFIPQYDDTIYVDFIKKINFNIINSSIVRAIVYNAPPYKITIENNN